MNKSASLKPFFEPRSVAIIGASETEGSVGRTLTLNLINSNFKGQVYLINPKRDQVFHEKAYMTVTDIPGVVDLVIIATPAKTVPDLLTECGQKKIPAVVIISAGFKELGTEGQKLEERVVAIAKEYGIRLIGPNCLGFMNPLQGLNATFAASMALKGSIAFLSQSGAMCTAVLDWSKAEDVGFSAFVSIGSMADVAWSDLIDYLGDDPNTKSIFLYMESIGDPNAFIEAASRVSPKKPIIVIKAGRTAEAAQAAASHTGSLAGSDEIFNVAMQKAGVIRVYNIAELFHLASVLAKQPLPKGPNLTIITNAGGPSVLATDATVLSGASLTKPAQETIEKLNTFLPSAWSHSNPVDILGDAKAERYEKTLEVVLKDPNSHGILVILSPQDMTEPEATAKSLGHFAKTQDIPIYASWMGGASVAKGIQILNDAGIPNFAYPDNACETFATLWKYQNKKQLPTTIITPKKTYFSSDMLKEGETLLKSLGKRTLLSEDEAKHFLDILGFPVVKTEIAKSALEAGNLADIIGYPVVAKLYSHTITHKSDVGGVQLNLQDRKAVETAYDLIHKNVLSHHSEEDFLGTTIQKMISLKGYEIILGSTTDSTFGPVVLFGLGGILVEVFKDSALAIPPLDASAALKLMEKTKIFQALNGVRGSKSADIEFLSHLIAKFSEMLLIFPQIQEVDINPLLVSVDDIIALDARILLKESIN